MSAIRLKIDQMVVISFSFFFSFIIGIRVEHDDEDELENRQIDVKYSIIGNLSRMIFRNLPTRHVPFVYPSYPTRCKL